MYPILVLDLALTLLPNSHKNLYRSSLNIVSFLIKPYRFFINLIILFLKINKAYRKPAISVEDIHFHQVGSWEQGDFEKRAHLANLMHMGSSTKIPRGAIVELTSDQFVDLEAQAAGKKAKVQTKRGYLQEWISDAKPLISFHPSAQNLKPGQTPPATALNFKDNPILGQIPLTLIATQSSPKTN